MASKEKNGGSTVLWWLGWIALTIASFFVSFHFWTGFITRHVGTMQEPHAPVLWVVAVFGSWMVLLVPLIVIMYHKVDKAYEDARLGRESLKAQRDKEELGVRFISLEDSARLLPKALTQKLKKIPQAVPRGHLVTACLKDGSRVDNVFVLDKRDVVGVYGLERLPFAIEDIVDVLPADLDHLPDFKAELWLRLDGIGAREVTPHG